MKYLTKDIMDKWITALRSGQYKQGLSYLRTSGGNHCCLGVLCDVLPEEAGKWHGVKFVFADDPTFETTSYLNGVVAREFNSLFGQPTVRKIFFDKLNATPWKSVVLSKGPDYQRVLAALNDLYTDHQRERVGTAARVNPDNLSAVPFTMLADWLEAAVAVADFSV
jgi:hypothetical protein